MTPAFRPAGRAARHAVALAAAFFLAAAGCTYKSGSTYKPEEAGAAMDVTRAQVLKSRPVVIEGLKDGQAVGWGTVIGATVAGAATYGLTGADTPLGTAVTIIAAVGGALVGTLAEEQVNRRPGAEYVLEREDGRTLAVVQSLEKGSEILPAGTRVLILHGRRGFVRVVAEGAAPAGTVAG